MDNLSVGKDRWVGAARKPTLLIEDICDPDACDRVIGETKPHTVIHLAAHHFIPLCEDNAYAAYQLNVYGTLNVLEHARRHGVSDFFLASYGAVYPPNFVPPRETNPHLLAEVTKQIALDGKRLVEVGNLWPLRDYVDVDSMASAIVDATAKIDGLEILNFGSGRAVEVREALRILTSVLPFKVEVKSVTERQRANDRPFLCPETSRLRRTIGRSADSFNEQTARKIFAEYPGLLKA